MQEHLEFKSARDRVKEIDKDSKCGFIAKKAHQEEKRRLLVWPQFKLRSHKIVCKI